ncbi:hypothetical protein ACOB87_00175 [Streptomyces sp. YS-B37]|uniref:hypothetical protein n=1 Tax=Streptomyces sp. YS-B37 TaxID=3407669 RepID=UPI003B502B35
MSREREATSVGRYPGKPVEGVVAGAGPQLPGDDTGRPAGVRGSRRRPPLLAVQET